MAVILRREAFCTHYNVPNLAILSGTILAVIWGAIQGGIDSVGNWLIGAESLDVGLYVS